MASPPIQLLDYVVEHLRFDVNPAYRHLDDRTAPAPGSFSLNLEVHWEEPQPTQNVLSSASSSGERAALDPPEEATDSVVTEVLPIDLVIRLNDDGDFSDDENGEVPFRLHLRLSGFFQRIAHEEMESRGRGDDYLMHTLATGISMLYGAARQVVASTLSQSPYEKVLLPAISPLQVARRVLDRRENASPNNS